MDKTKRFTPKTNTLFDKRNHLSIEKMYDIIIKMGEVLSG